MNTKKTPERELLMTAIARGMENGQIGAARLMSPDEMSVVLRGRPELQGKVGAWCLCTYVPTEMWQHLLDTQLQAVPPYLTVVQAESGRRYLYVALQTEGWQHRVCVPLVGILTARWLGTLLSGDPLQLSIGSPERDLAQVSLINVPPDVIVQFRNINTVVPADWRGLLEESMKMLAWNGAFAGEDRAVWMPEPSAVSLSLLFPAEVQAELERISDAAVGRKAS